MPAEYRRTARDELHVFPIEFAPRFPLAPLALGALTFQLTRLKQCGSDLVLRLGLFGATRTAHVPDRPPDREHEQRDREQDNGENDLPAGEIE